MSSAPAPTSPGMQSPPPAGIGVYEIIVLLILVLLVFGPAILSYRVAKRKGHDPIGWLIIGMIPIVNLGTTIYILSASGDRPTSLGANSIVSGGGPLPAGLIVLAVIQFLFCLGVLPILLGPTRYGLYGVLSPLVTAVVLVISAVGYLKRHYRMGFVGGNILGVGSIANVVIFNAIFSSGDFSTHVPSLIYPLVLLALLNFRYKAEFVQDKLSSSV